MLLAALRLNQPVSGRQRLGLLAAFAGVALVALGHGGAADPSGSSMIGAAWLLISAIAIAYYYVASVELAEMHGTAAIVAWSTVFGFIALLPWAGWEMARMPFRITAEAAGAALYLGLVVTVAGLFLWLHLLRTVPARIAASVQYLQPIVGVAASAAMFGETMGMPFAAGVILVLAGIALSVMSRRMSARAP